MIVLTPRVVKDDWAKLTTPLGEVVMRLEDWQCRQEEERECAGNFHRESSIVAWLRNIGHRNTIISETLESQKFGIRVEMGDFQKNSINWELFSSEVEARVYVEEVYLICSYCGEFKFDNSHCTRCNMIYLFND